MAVVAAAGFLSSTVVAAAGFSAQQREQLLLRGDHVLNGLR